MSKWIRVTRDNVHFISDSDYDVFYWQKEGYTVEYNIVPTALELAWHLDQCAEGDNYHNLVGIHEALINAIMEDTPQGLMERLEAIGGIHNFRGKL